MHILTKLVDIFIQPARSIYRIRYAIFTIVLDEQITLH